MKLIYELSKCGSTKKVYDPYCGTGGILLKFFLMNASSNKGFIDKNYAKTNLFGSEISKSVSLLAKMNMVLAGDGHSNIDNEDSLSISNINIKDDKQFDIVATNMPFKPDVPDNMQDDYLILSNESSNTAKFIEHCINRCKVNGRILIITSKGFLTEEKSAEFRRKLISRYHLESVYMLYEGLFHPYTQAFACLLVINKSEPLGYTDFYSISGHEDALVVSKYFNHKDRYNKKGFYKVAHDDILSNKNVDLRGLIYKYKKKKYTTLGDLVEYIKPKKVTDANGLKKLSTPNQIKDGINMIPNRSTKRLSVNRVALNLY